MLIERACGVLSWSPQAFWQSNYFELSHALVGYMKTNGLGKWNPKLNESIKHWNKKDHEKAQAELDVVNSIKDRPKNLPDDVRKRMKERKQKRGHTN